MSSVTRFIRQINNNNAYVAASAALLAAPATYAFELVPDAGNVVGNYAPGFMRAAPSSLINAIDALKLANPVLRDMGKTVRAPLGSASGAIGYFRQVQLLVPSGESGNFIGGPSGHVGGVVGGSPDAYSPYLTFYVPVVVYGVNAVPAGMAPAVLFGQM